MRILTFQENGNETNSGFNQAGRQQKTLSKLVTTKLIHIALVLDLQVKSGAGF
jgi:hypothetical protein